MSKRGAQRQRYSQRNLFPPKLILLSFGVLFGVLVWFAPTLLLNSPLKHPILRRVTEGFRGQVVAGKISAGWLSPIVIHSIVALDADGEQLLEAEALASEKPLVALLANRNELGQFRVNRPRLHLQLRSDGSNLEDAIRPWLEQPSAGAMPSCGLEIVDGTIRAEDRVSQTNWSLEKINATLALAAQPQGAMSLDWRSQVTSSATSTGDLTAKLSWHPAPSGSATQSARATLEVEMAAVPLGLAEAALRPYEPNLQLSGTVGGALRIQWGGSRQSIQLDTIQVNQLSVAAPSVLGSDRFVISSLAAGGTVTTAGSSWKFDKLTVDSDVLKLEAHGSGVLASAQPTIEQLAQSWQQGRYEFGGTIDLAELAHILPNTLRIRAGTHISAGTVAFALSGKPAEESQLWESRLQVSDLAAMHQGRYVRWENPVSVRCLAKRQGETFSLKQLDCESNFLKISARGSAAKGTLHADGDLSGFLAEISRFVDLGELGVAGRLKADLDWQQSSEGRLEIRGTAAADNFEFHTAVRHLDGSFQLQADAAITEERFEVKSSRLGITDLNCEEKGLAVQEPGIEVRAAGSWHWDLGELAVQTATVVSSSLSLEADAIRIKIQPEEFRITGDARYRCDLDRLWASVQSGGRPLNQRIGGQVTGQAQFAYAPGVTTADWSADASEVRVRRRAALAAAAENSAPAAQEPWQVLFAEPQITISGKARYDHREDRILVDRLQAASQSVSLGANGVVRQPWTRCDLDLQGRIGYDLQRVTRRFGKRFPRSVQIAGRDSRPFAVRGPLWGEPSVSEPGAEAPSAPGPSSQAASRWLAEMIAQASLSWDAADIQGLTIGSGLVETKLSDGIVQFAPIDLPVSEGRVRLEPRLELNADALTLKLPGGDVVQQVQITPEVCRVWLKYLAPLVAEAADAQGKFSLSINRTAVPIQDPGSASIDGRLTVHSVKIGPGPLARELIWIAEQVKAIRQRRRPGAQNRGSSPWLTLPEQQISFRMAQRRVHHQGLKMKIDDVVIRTTGSVGLDQSLDLTAEIPIRDQWVERDEYLSSLRGQVIKLPIGGTLSSPQVDSRSLDQLARRLMTGTVNKFLETELNRGMERLLSPRD